MNSVQHSDDESSARDLNDKDEHYTDLRGMALYDALNAYRRNASKKSKKLVREIVVEEGSEDQVTTFAGTALREKTNSNRVSGQQIDYN